MSVIVDRMIRAAKLDPTLYEEIEKDEGAMGQAVAVVLISSAAAGIGGLGMGGLGLIAAGIAALVGWAIWAVLTHLVGTRILAEPGTSADLGQVLRVTGFAMAPGVIRIVAFIPVLGALVNLVAVVWMLAAFVVAIRQVMDYSSTGRAVGVCLIGWVIQLVITGLFLMITVGGAFLAASSL